MISFVIFDWSSRRCQSIIQRHYITVNRHFDKNYVHVIHAYALTSWFYDTATTCVSVGGTGISIWATKGLLWQFELITKTDPSLRCKLFIQRFPLVLLLVFWTNRHKIWRSSPRSFIFSERIRPALIPTCYLTGTFALHCFHICSRGAHQPRSTDGGCWTARV